jgi:hypothetical protein
VVAGTTYTFVTALSGSTPNEVLEYTASGTASTNETDTAKNLEAAINNVSTQCTAAPCFLNVSAANPKVTATESTNTVTLTAKTAGYAGNFNVLWGPDDAEQELIAISQTTPGDGPGYVSGITLGTAGSGYGPNAAMTISGGSGTNALAVANTSTTTVPTTYQPAYGAKPGYDLATGLGSVNAYNLACNSAWTSSAYTCTTTAVSSSANPSGFGESVSFTATVTGSSPTGTVQFYVDGSLVRYRDSVCGFGDVD